MSPCRYVDAWECASACKASDITISHVGDRSHIHSTQTFVFANAEIVLRAFFRSSSVERINQRCVSYCLCGVRSIVANPEQVHRLFQGLNMTTENLLGQFRFQLFIVLVPARAMDAGNTTWPMLTKKDL